MMRFFGLLVAVACSAVLGGVGIARADIEGVFLMDHDPTVSAQAPVRIFASKLGDVWLQALGRPEADMQRMAADAISRGVRVAVPDLQQAVPRLVELLTGERSHPAVRVACARALVALDARSAAPAMAEAARRFGADVRLVVEPVLADWKYEAFIPDWEGRLKSAEVHYRDLILAIRCLTVINRAEVVDQLLKFVHDPHARSDVRAAAARAAGLLRAEGMLPDAIRLTADANPSHLQRLCAAELLTRHQGAEAQALLLKFAVDPEPAVSAISLRRLLQIDPELVLPLAESSMRNSDVHVRQLGSEAYIRLPDPQRVAVLTRLLDDPDPKLRRSMASVLLDLTKRSELDAPIREAASQMLAGDRWRGQEQAALLLGSLDHKASAARFLELLDSPRPEVEVAAAWALKSLAIPETLPTLLERATRLTALRRTPGPYPGGVDKEVGHIFELFGKLKYAPSEPLLREHIPKQFELGLYTRAAAIWTLGHLHAGKPDEGLAAQYLERIRDIGPPPEVRPVQMQSAVAIGRMKAVSRLPDIQAMISPESPSSHDTEVYRWIMLQLTGEPYVELKPSKIGVAGWFLEALDD